ncbi:sodium:solute symporter family protein [Alkaliphilus hydrothermalis]|uniref:SSS family solute:Na+ symporter n=1 Tax=Alkaliphilus hydrothermalis TaxID=1482730 RepID=A0ABS2NU87_9FIRM|nr:sodium:solute symporter family protein [Alkaliphilus hydrothermalis]MBM7616149.1 SSS family solute:Na+ symporter [Alkaliphilus hydrothermalis]
MLTSIDNIVIFIILLGVIAIGYHFSKSVKDMESYYLANRSLPWSLVVGTLVASWYGGVGVVGTIGYASAFGLASWFIWSIGAHAVRFPLALWVGPKIHVRSDITIPDVLHSVYGKSVAVLGSIFLFIYCSQLGEITATGYIGVAAWGADKVVVGVVIVLITILLTCLGGLMGVAVTDMIFFFFMVGSVSSVFPTIYSNVGGLVGIREALSATPAVTAPIAGMPFSKALMLIILCLNVYADPSFYQRFSASNSAKTGRRAMLTCFSLWLGFDMILVLAGIIVRATNPTAIPEVGYIEMVLSYLPVGVRGLFIVGLVGALVSTLDSYYLIGGTTLANDIYGRVFSKEPLSDKKIILLSRIGSVLLGLIGLSLAFKFTMVYDAIAFLMSLWMSAAFVPVLLALMYKGKKTPMAGLLSMISGVVFFTYFKTNPFVLSESFGTLEPILIALPASLLFWIIGNQIGEDKNANNVKLQVY